MKISNLSEIPREGEKGILNFLNGRGMDLFLKGPILSCVDLTTTSL